MSRSTYLAKLDKWYPSRRKIKEQLYGLAQGLDDEYRFEKPIETSRGAYIGLTNQNIVYETESGFIEYTSIKANFLTTTTIRKIIKQFNKETSNFYKTI